jgi:RNA polymerase sigma factor (sigma-70 family)
MEDLVEQTRSGDRAALNELLIRNLDSVRAFARLRMGSMLRARESSTDIVQSACREVLEDCADFEYRGESSFRAWLCLQVERKLRARARHWKAERRDMRREESPAASNDSTADLTRCYASFDSPSRVASGHELIERIEGAFDRLSESDRELVVMARIVGLPGRELAAHIGRDEASTRTLLSRALARLARFADI